MARKRFENIGSLDKKLSLNPKISNEIKLSLIKPNPYQPRFDEEVEELKETIKRDGQLQSILLMIHESQYYIVGGHRRFKACSELGFETIRADVNKDITMEDMQRLALIENIQREQLQALEIALSIKELLDNGAYKTKVELATALGKNAAYVSKMLNILNLEEEILSYLKEHRLSIGLEVLNELQGIEDTKKQIEWFQKYLTGSINVKDIRAYKTSLKITSSQEIFTTKNTSKKYSMLCDWSKWEDQKKINFEKELQNLLVKYQ